MPDFWSYVTRGKYSVGCTGQTVYIYENGKEIQCLKGFQYTYKSCISPNLDYFALKSNTGIMYLYSLSDYSLVEKVRFMKEDSSQDGIFTFSVTGEEIISVDQYEGGIHGCISYYSVPNLEFKQRVFHDNDIIEPTSIELTEEEDTIYSLMYERNDTGVASKFFVALLKDDKIVEKTYITEKEYDFYSDYKSIQADGFTEKSIKWSSFKSDSSAIKTGGFSLAKLMKKE